LILSTCAIFAKLQTKVTFRRAAVKVGAVS
jgi:hypothetical protein